MHFDLHFLFFATAESCFWGNRAKSWTSWRTRTPTWCEDLTREEQAWMVRLRQLEREEWTRTASCYSLFLLQERLLEVSNWQWSSVILNTSFLFNIYIYYFFFLHCPLHKLLKPTVRMSEQLKKSGQRDLFWTAPFGPRTLDCVCCIGLTCFLVCFDV